MVYGAINPYPVHSPSMPVYNPYLQPVSGGIAQPVYNPTSSLGFVDAPWDQPSAIIPATSPLPTSPTPAINAAPTTSFASKVPTLEVQLDPSANGFNFGFEDYGVSAERLNQLLLGLSPENARMFNELQVLKTQIALNFGSWTNEPAKQQEARYWFDEAKTLQVDILGLKMPATTASTVSVQTQPTTPTAVSQPVVNQQVANSPAESSIKPESFVPVTPTNSEPAATASQNSTPSTTATEPVATVGTQGSSPSQPVVEKPVEQAPVEQSAPATSAPVETAPAQQSEPTVIQEQQQQQQPAVSTPQEPATTATPTTNTESGETSQPVEQSQPEKWSRHPHGGPPGLAKKNKVPPGHRKKQKHSESHENHSHCDDREDSWKEKRIVIRFDDLVQKVGKRLGISKKKD